MNLYPNSLFEARPPAEERPTAEWSAPERALFPVEEPSPPAGTVPAEELFLPTAEPLPPAEAPLADERLDPPKLQASSRSLARCRTGS
jgi:hypothetical protein